MSTQDPHWDEYARQLGWMLDIVGERERLHFQLHKRLFEVLDLDDESEVPTNLAAIRRDVERDWKRLQELTGDRRET